MKRNRKIPAVLLTTALLLVLTACGSRQEVSASQIEPAAEAHSAGMPNPIREVTAEEMVAAVGVPLYAPGASENVRYSTITADETVIGQMDFTLDGKEYTYRTTTAALDVTELSGMYFTAATESDAKVSYAKGKILTEGNTSVLYWEDIVPGVRYTLTCTDCADPSILLEIAEETFKPLQGDDSGDGWEGNWVDADGSTVELMPVGMQKYEAVVGIFRLAEFTGTAEQDAAGMNLTLKAPDGSTVYATFCPEEDGTAGLHIAESSWSLLESGTELTGFHRQ